MLALDTGRPLPITFLRLSELPVSFSAQFRNTRASFRQLMGQRPELRQLPGAVRQQLVALHAWDVVLCKVFLAILA